MKKSYTFRNILIWISIISIIGVSLYYLISSYIENRPKLQYTFSESTSENMVEYPNAKFAVISDLHYYDNSIGTTGTAFEEVLKSDRKLLKDSADLLDLAIDNILKSDVKFVLVPGDITKDGERQCHDKVSKALSKLTQNGIKVFVVPGNHDVNNPLAYKYDGDNTIPIPSITQDEFANIYEDFGYGSAIYRDKDTLSYVAEPTENLWIVALDTCRYKENKPGEEEIYSGKISQEQEEWLCDILKNANKNKKAVIVLEHHGLIEHWTGQSKIHPEYLIPDYKRVGELMASYNVRLAFTGHYHAQDIAMSKFDNGSFLYDIETGALITAPCAVRYCSIDNNKITIKSDFLVDKLHPNTTYAKEARQFVFSTVKGEAYKKLKEYYVSDEDANKISDYLGESFLANYDGDEDENKQPSFNEKDLDIWSRIVYSNQKYIIEGLWKDIYPEDNNVTLDLR